MVCSCTNSSCRCDEHAQCECCPFLCECQQCFIGRGQFGARCDPCGGEIHPDLCSTIDRVSPLLTPSMDFLRRHNHWFSQIFGQCDCSGGSCACCPFLCGNREHCQIQRNLNMNLTACQKCDSLEQLQPADCDMINERTRNGIHPSMELLSAHAVGHHQIVPRRPPIPPPPPPPPPPPQDSDDGSPSSRKSLQSNDSLQFQMDDLGEGPNISKHTSTSSKCGNVQENLALDFNENISCTASLKLHDPTSSNSSYCRDRSCTDGLKCTEQFQNNMTKCPPQKCESNWRESPENEISVIPQEAAGYSHRNSGTSISDVYSSRVEKASLLSTVAAIDFKKSERETKISTPGDSGNDHCNPNVTDSKLESELTEVSEHRIDAAELNSAKSHESEMINNSSCSYRIKLPKREKSVTDNSSNIASQSAGEYASGSRSLNLQFDSQTSTCLQSPTRQLSISKLSTNDLSQSVGEFKSLERQASNSGGTETSPTSNLSKMKTITIFDSRPKDKSTSFESNSNFLPQNMPKKDERDVPHGQPVITSKSVKSSKIDKSATQAESTETSQFTLSNLDLKIPYESKSDLSNDNISQ